MFWCTVNRTFYRANPSTPKHFIRQFFSVPIVSYGVLDGGSYKKLKKKIDFCHFFRDVLSLGWGGMGELWCKHLNYSLQMGQIWLIMTQNDWLWPRMTYQGSWGHQGVQGGATGHQGAPGGSRLPPTPKREIKQQNNGPKSWFKVPKVCPDPKGKVFTLFWGIWGHLDA